MNKIFMLFCLVFNSGLLSCGYPTPTTTADEIEPTFSPPANQIFMPVVTKSLIGYFVATNGNDGNPGTISLPWKTLGKAARMVKPGDTVYIRGGTYNEAPNFTTSGTEAKPIRIMAYPGETPIVDGYNQLPPSYRGLVNVDGDWVQISGLETQNTKYYGLGLYGKHDSASNVFVHHSQKAGIIISGDYGIVENSRIWRNSMQNEYGVSSSWSSGIAAGNDGTDGLTEYAIIRKNVVWENWGQGINTNESNQSIIEDNIAYDNFVTNIYISDSTNVLCQRNFVYTNPASYVFPYGNHIGIMIGDEVYTPLSANIKVINNIAYGNNWNLGLYKGVQGLPINNILIANNTFVNGIIQGGVLLRGYHTNVVFENNIVQQDGTLPSVLITLSPQVSFINNLWTQPPEDAVLGPGNIVGDPKLAKTGNPFSIDWFRSTALSPAIDKAVVIPEIVSDFFNHSRGAHPDIGAIEFFP